jgi:hypothetical protein
MINKIKKGGKIHSSMRTIIDKNNSSIEAKIQKNESILLFNTFNLEVINKSDIIDIFPHVISLFEEYNNTNNGIILNNSEILTKLVNKSGGGVGCLEGIFKRYREKKETKETKEAEETYSLPDLQNEIIKFCKNYNTNKILEEYIKRPENTNIINDYSNLKKFIDANKNLFEIKLINEIYNYYDYNKDIVLAYEYNLFINIDNINNYIDKQNEYLKTLSIDDQITIYDYTLQESFQFYKLFKMNNKKWMDLCNYQYNAFAPQIKKLGYYDIDDIINVDKNRSGTYSKYVLSINEWTDVLNLFSKDLDRIINNSPELEYNIYCYRGASKHYIYNDSSFEIDENEDIYKFKEQTSFTLDFFIAYKFYNSLSIDLSSSSNPSCIYRTTILKGSKALFISKCSAVNNEMEILIPTNTYVIKNTKRIETSYNNITNKYDICSNSSIKFNSLDIIIYNNNPRDDNIDDIQLEIDPIIDDNFSIVTANIFNLGLCSNPDKIEKLVNKLIKYEPTIVCIQESNDNIQHYMDKNGYTLTATNYNGSNINEIIQIYIKNSDIKKFQDNSITTSINCFTERNDIIINFNFIKDLKIGIVHLCGGKFDEKTINSKLESISIDQDEIDYYQDASYDKKFISTDEWISRVGYLSPEDREKLINHSYKINEEFNNKLIKIKKLKCENIKNIIENDVDIILGDFNSDFEDFLGVKNDKQYKFLIDNASLNDKYINIWNTYIYHLLNKKSYKNICDNDCKKFYEKQHTSIYETSPDVIYYKNNKLEVKEYKIINLIRGKYSDHNAIYAKFLIK